MIKTSPVLAEEFTKKAEMIIDMHIHPYCKEVHLVLDVDEGLQRQFVSPYRPVNQEKMALRRKLFTKGGAGDILAQMDESGVDRAVIVAFDLTTAYGVVKQSGRRCTRLVFFTAGRNRPAPHSCSGRSGGCRGLTCAGL